MELERGSIIKGANCLFKVEGLLGSGVYISNLILVSKAGNRDTNEIYLLITHKSVMDRYLENKNNPVVGRLQSHGETVLIAPDENSVRDVLIGYEYAQDTTVEEYYPEVYPQVNDVVEIDKSMVSPVQKSILSLIWDKSWRLLAALLLFGLAAASVWFINYIFTSGSHVRVNLWVLIAPLLLGGWGLKTLYYFFVYLFKST